METLKRIKTLIPIEHPKQVVKLMQELKIYETMVTTDDLEPILEQPDPIDRPTESAFRIHHPSVDDRCPTKDIREFAWAIGLNAKQHAVYIDLISIGDIAHMTIPSWDIYRGTYHFEATHVVVVHNHPSGDPTPSPSDIDFTTNVIMGGLFLRRPLVDHIILGDDSYYSFSADAGINGFSHLHERARIRLLGEDEMKQAYEHALQDKDDIISEKDDENEKLKALLKANNIKIN